MHGSCGLYCPLCNNRRRVVPRTSPGSEGLLPATSCEVSMKATVGALSDWKRVGGCRGRFGRLGRESLVAALGRRGVGAGSRGSWESRISLSISFRLVHSCGALNPSVPQRWRSWPTPCGLTFYTRVPLQPVLKTHTSAASKPPGWSSRPRH